MSRKNTLPTTLVEPAVLDWLLGGDPAIAWQTERDLLDAPPGVWEPLRQRDAEGRWARGKLHSGREFFAMEPAGPSRWNTLRALRVLRWWQGGES
jgi:hypothetical protein